MIQKPKCPYWRGITLPNIATYTYLNPPPPCNPPPAWQSPLPGGTFIWPNNHRKYWAAQFCGAFFPHPPLLRGELSRHWWGDYKAGKVLGAEENFYKAPKLIYTVILWYRFVVQSPHPPAEGEPSLRNRPPRHDNGGEITRGG